jgi:uncharacterized membrane protein SpoIIM required for sporulation
MVAIGILLFIASALAGVVSPDSVKGALYGYFSERTKEIESAVKGGGLIILPLLIFSNNLMVSLIILALFPTIIGPWIFMSFQGFATGAIISYQGVDEGISNLTSFIPGCRLSPNELAIAKLSLLIPHGVFEITGIGVFFASSVRLSIELLGYIMWKLGKKQEKPNISRAFGSLIIPLLIGVLLLIVAAFVESFITPIIGFISIVFLCR